jgi:proline dehydrogenase
VDDSEATAGSSTKRKKGQPVYKRCVDEMIRSIDVAADFEDDVVGKESHNGRRTWVAIIMTTLLPDAQSLIALSSHIMATRPQHYPSIPFPGCPRPSDLSVLDGQTDSKFLDDKDISSLRELYSNLRRICLHAQQKGVKLIIDAEYSWYQPAIDAMQLSLMREFNRISPTDDNSGPLVQPLIYGTFQAYLRRTPLHLVQAYRDAQENNYALGVKLVRGAYHPHEITAHEEAPIPGHRSLSISPDSLPPVWMTKDETDRCYNECIKMLVEWVQDDVPSNRLAGEDPPKCPKIGVLFGTHNWTSTRLILSELVRNRLASATGMENEEGEAVLRLDDQVTERVTLGQLFGMWFILECNIKRVVFLFPIGMCDGLTDYIVQRTMSNTPIVIK